MTRRTFAAGALATALAPARAAGEAFPNRAITCIVGFPAGGSVDFVARAVGEKLADRLGQPFVVDNKPGAGGNLGAAIAAKAAPNGYTVFIASSANAVSPFLYKSLQYDPRRDFVYVSRWITTSYMVVVRADHPARTLQELLALARKDPGKVTLGTQGMGTPPHLAGELLSAQAGLRVLQVPFKGGPETMTALLSGVVDFTFAPIPIALPQVRSGRLRLLALTAPSRSALHPDVPTVAELGLPDYQITAWYGLAVPVGTPADVVRLLDSHTQAVLAQAEVRDKLASQGMEPAPLGPERFASFFAQEVKAYGKLVADAKIVAS